MFWKSFQLYSETLSSQCIDFLIEHKVIHIILTPPGMKPKTYYICTQSVYVNVWVWILAPTWELQCEGTYAFSVNNYEYLGDFF